ncbi:hypothetical protein GCM10020331_036420 [Ectobacillus funiculus]
MKQKESVWNSYQALWILLIFDGIHTVLDKDAFGRVKELAKREGLLVGSSSGAAFHASLLEAQAAPSGTNIVTIFFPTAVSDI